MKKTICLFILLLFFLNLNAQFSEKNAIYLIGELNAGNFSGGNSSLNYVFDNKYSFQAGISGLIRESKSQPADFSSGTILLFGSSSSVQEEMQNYQILVGKIFVLNKSGTIRFNMATGIGYTILKEAKNWKHVSNLSTYGFRRGENYTYDIERHGTLSLIINPRVEFPFSRYFGLTLSPILQINKDRTYIGFGVGMMIGLLRKKKN